MTHDRSIDALRRIRSAIHPDGTLSTRPGEVIVTRADLIERMVLGLRCIDVDLGDERDVIVKLKNLGFLALDIEASVEEVIEETRRRGLKRSWA